MKTENSNSIYTIKNNGTLNISEEYKKPSISFYENDSIEAIMIIKEGKFIWKGQEIEDIYKIYEKMNQWLNNQNK